MEFFKTTECQSGRSMVEMLGVLAIIGVLSIGGIAGYTVAMNRYKANEIMNDVNTRAVMISSYITTNGNLPSGETYDVGLDNTNTLGYPVSTYSSDTTTTFIVQVDNVSASVCRQIFNQEWNIPFYIVDEGGLDLTPITTAEDCGDVSANIAFEFSNNLSTDFVGCEYPTPYWNGTQCVECLENTHCVRWRVLCVGQCVNNACDMSVCHKPE